VAIVDLYEDDFYVWTQEQAAALRAAGKAGGKSNAVEWERVAEEVEDLGKRDLREASSYVALIIEHLYKLAWTQREEPKAGWRAEIVRFQGNLELILTAALRAKIDTDMDRLHRIALRDAKASFEMHEPDAPRDEALRWTLDEVLGE